MQLDRQSFHELVQLLDGFNYCIFSGFAVKVFCDPGRECGDIDIMVPHQEIEKLAEKMGTEVRRRKEDGEGGANDYGFETSYSGLPVEVTSGFPRKRFKEGTLDKVIENRVEKEFMGENIYLARVEELIALKASMMRDKDKRDIKNLKENCEYDKEFLEEIAEDWGEKDKILGRIGEV